MRHARLMDRGSELAVRRPPVALQHPRKARPSTAAASANPRPAATRYTVMCRPTTAHSHARRPATRQPVSSGATTGLALTPATSAV